MSAAVRILLTGSTGQLGRALAASVPQGIELITPAREELDLADPGSCRAAVESHRPGWVLNAGAYTAVDRAEAEPDLALAVNAGGPGALAEAMAATGGRMLQLSTDFVFDGSQGHPYTPHQPAAPLGIYGATKAEGERRVLEALGPERACLLRTSWVYGPVGRNFCLTMLRLHRERSSRRESLGVVADQVGCPTASHTLAEACWAVLLGRLGGILHWSDAGAASWYDFALAIGELAVERRLLSQSAQVHPLTTADYPTPARRPPYSLLECSDSRRRLGLAPLHWRAALAGVLERLASATPAGSLP